MPKDDYSTQRFQEMAAEFKADFPALLADQLATARREDLGRVILLLSDLYAAAGKTDRGLGLHGLMQIYAAGGHRSVLRPFEGISAEDPPSEAPGS